MSDEEQRIKNLEKLTNLLNKPMQEEVQAWLDIANGLHTYEEVKGSVHPVLRSRSLELVEEWAKKGASDE